MEAIFRLSIDVILLNWVESAAVILSEFVEDHLVSLQDGELIANISWDGHSYIREVFPVEEEKAMSPQVGEQFSTEFVSLKLDALCHVRKLVLDILKLAKSLFPLVLNLLPVAIDDLLVGEDETVHDSFDRHTSFRL